MKSSFSALWSNAPLHKEWSCWPAANRSFSLLGHWFLALDGWYCDFNFYPYEKLHFPSIQLSKSCLKRRFLYSVIRTRFSVVKAIQEAMTQADSSDSSAWKPSSFRSSSTNWSPNLKYSLRAMSRFCGRIQFETLNWNAPWMSVNYVIRLSPDRANDTRFGHLVQNWAPNHSAETYRFFKVLVCHEQ